VNLPIQNVSSITKFWLDKYNNQNIIIKKTLELIKMILNQNFLIQFYSIQYTNHTKNSDWETSAQHSTITHLCALFKAYSGERASKAIRDRLSSVDHVRKIRDRKQRTDIGKYSFVHRTIKNWNYLHKR